MRHRFLPAIVSLVTTARVTSLFALSTAAMVGACDDSTTNGATTTTDTSATTVGPDTTDVSPGGLPTQVAPVNPGSSTTSVSPATSDTTNAPDTTTADATGTDATSTDTTSTDTTNDPVTPPPTGTRCSEGLQSGTACDPGLDTSACELTAQTCTCAAGTWACAPSSDTTSDVDTADMSMTGATNSDSGTSTDTTSTTDTGGEPAGMTWLPSWATTMQRTEDKNEPPPLSGKTLRQFVWPSYSGDQIRIQLSNERGEAAVELSKVHIAHAMPLGQGQIDATTDAQFTWAGSPSVTIPPGETAWSDALTFELTEMEPMAVTMHFTSAPNDVTGHPGARTTSYVANGDVVSAAGISGETRDRWYFINAIEVMAPADAYAVAVLGDSITDGYGVLNEFARWPDFLNIAINSDPMIADKVSVLNFGMGANNLTTGNEDMDPGTERFERDVLGRADKIKWLIVLIGVNDIIATNSNMVDGTVVANTVTAAYQEIIDKSHNAGILVYGSPITPFASNTQGAALNVRSEVNMWITTSNAFDAIVDLAAAVADPSNDAQLAPQFSNDGLHPSTAGYEAMGQAVDLSLFYNTMP